MRARTVCVLWPAGMSCYIYALARNMQIAVDKLKWEIDVPFWSQQISFLCVGLIIVASIRGLLLQMAKVHRAGLGHLGGLPLRGSTWAVVSNKEGER